MRIIILLLLFALASCSSKKNMVEYDFSMIDTNYSNSISYTPTIEERKYFKSVLDVFLMQYKDISKKEYIIQYSFYKNKFNDTEVWLSVLPYSNSYLPLCPEEGPIKSTHSELNYYAIINITQERAYFHRDSVNMPYLDDEKVITITSYFYFKGETREVNNSFLYLDNPTIWREFNFKDWDKGPIAK